MFPTLFTIGGFTLHTYGLMLLLAFAATLAWTWREARSKGLEAKLLFPGVAFALFLGAVLGGRLAAVPHNWDLFVEQPWSLLVGWRGDQSSLGAAGLSVILAGGYMIWKRQPLLMWLDAFAPGCALGAAILRVGCFSAGCCYGCTCHLPWAVTFTHPDSLAPLHLPLHPTQIYSIQGGLISFGILLAMKKRFRVPGRLMGLFFCLYAVYRFIIDFYRLDHAPILGPLSMIQIGLAVFFLAGVFLLLRPGKGEQAAQDTSGTPPE
ncbi:MAG: prolipoprotein diacylglyceryl transferase [Desulfovibrio sp.]|nr:MAG: prolipoprotein diacylglyceryl transferase [Desulfovibrio sp.]